MKRVLLLVSLLSLLAYLATGVYEIRPGEQGVVRRFGRVSGVPRGPGLLLTLPWGFEQVDRVAVDEQRVIEVGFQEGDTHGSASPIAGEVLTGDNHLVNVRARVFFRVDGSNAQAVIDYAMNRDRVSAILARETESTLALVLAGRTADPMLFGTDRTLEADLRTRLAARLRPLGLGIVIDRVNLAYIRVPSELAEVFHDVARAKTQGQATEREAENQRQSLLSQARQEGTRTRGEARRENHERLDQARTEARNFRLLWIAQTGAGRDPQIALDTLYLQVIPKVFARFRVRTLTDGKFHHIILVPLPKE